MPVPSFSLLTARAWIFAAGAALLALGSTAQALPVLRTEAALQSALRDAKPGDTLIIGNGRWANLTIKWTASGTKTQLITLRAEEMGKVILTGNSSLRLGGDYQVIDGLVFRDGYAEKGAVIEFMVNDDHVANHSRVTNCAIDHYNPPDRFKQNSWVVFYGRHNRLDHSYLGGKLNLAPAVIVELNDERHRQNFHRIDHNYFGYRPRLGSNGGETLRIGISAFCLFSSNTTVEQNYFERCSGEVEIVSVKSSDNIVRDNVFVECEGVVALRHGDRNLVEGNFFLGNGKPFTGGIRVVNESHLIRGNHLQDLRGERFFGTLAVMNGVPNSLQNRYMPVLDVLVTRNRFFNCGDIEFGTGRDHERSVPPDRCRFEDNLVFHQDARPPVTSLDSLKGVTFTGNRAAMGGQPPSFDGFAFTAQTYAKGTDGLYAGGDYQPRLPVTLQECGPTAYTPIPEHPARKYAGTVTPVGPGQNTLADAVEASQPGDTLELTAGANYPIDRTLKVRHPLIIRTPIGASGRATVHVVNNQGEVPIVELENGGSFTAQGLRFDGASDRGVAQAGITTWRQPMIDHLTVMVSDCDFVNFDSERYSAFIMRKSTFADTVSFVNCTFQKISGNAISLQAETDDTGRYNAEHVTIRNCLFRDIMGSALDLYRGSNDESTTGPLLRLDHCTFINVNNVELGSVLRLTGVQDGDVRNCVFVDSGQSGRAIRMEDHRWCRLLVSHVNLMNSGRIESFYPDRCGPKITRLAVALADPANGDFSLAADSPLAGQASDGTNLGVKWTQGYLRD